MTLDELVGRHKLTGVDRLNPDGDPAEAIRFTLDGITYIAMEDENDGYRSSMAEIKTTPDAPMTTFPAVPVMARMVEGVWEYASPPHDLLELIDERNGKSILFVGTQDVDDYYPSFVAQWRPEDLADNTGEAK